MSKSQNPAYGTLGQAIRSRNSAPTAGIGAFTGSFGFQAEVHWTYISQIERGVKSPTLRIIEDLAEALEIEVSVLVQMAEQESPADAGL